MNNYTEGLSWLQGDSMPTWDSFNNSTASTASSINNTDSLWHINQSRSSVITSSDEQSINFSGSLPNTPSVTQLEGASPQRAVTPQTKDNYSSNKLQGVNTVTNNRLHEQWGFTPSTFFTAMVDCGGQSIDYSDMAEWMKLAYATDSQYKVPNCKGAHVRVVSQPDVKQWRHLLKNYKLSRVCDYVEFGFPLTLDYENFSYNTDVENHPSATQFPDVVNDYLKIETAHNAIVGPFDASPFQNLHVSPMMTRPKPDGSGRIIIDMSWPHGDSVNTHIPDQLFDDMTFQLRYPTVDNVVTQIAIIGPKAQLYKINLKRAYRNLRTDPRDFTVLSLLWKGQCYVDVSVAFGIKTGVSAFQMVTDCITHLMASQDHWTCAYLDDILGVATPAKAQHVFTSLNNLIYTLGLPINQKKVVAKTHEMTCLGININARTGILTIPQEKVQQIKHLCNQWASKAHATRRSIQRLLGHLLYIHMCAAI